ncbi:MAG TPA: TIGR01777 family oxidoreductase [Kiritimatiellia bacterium]|nr:TIGR01777 family oxidoreductase [Kiritimatiellia bacterium]HMO98214.1 TIGR01777 family oxidoreductase [Kiritimatiellia bacterium]HMP97664.1 TIGR01777 family oxidoreductase [Kiritimatiellia bacterium]
MKVLVTGSSGLIGGALITRLTGAGHYVVRLVRGTPDRSRGDVVWDPVTGHIERSQLKGIEGVVHLAGENILGLWTKSKKERIHKSRVVATEYLAEALAGMVVRPEVMISASAVGFYGDRGDEWLPEHAPAGRGFLPQLCREWEDASAIARNAGIRVVHPRIGIVLTPRGGALGQMLGPFKMGLGGPIGRGRQYMSWITLDDLLDAFLFMLENPELSGPVNAVSPDPVTNRDFTKTLARTLHRPAFLPVPSFLLNALPGGMARETLLASARVQPAKLQRAGFTYQHSDLESALTHLVG